MKMSSPNSRRGKILPSSIRRIVFNIVKYLETEKKMNRHTMFLKTNALTVQITSYNKNTVSKIKKEGMRAKNNGVQLQTPDKGQVGKRNSRVPVDNILLMAIKQALSSLYNNRKDPPTMENILRIAKTNLNFKGSKSTLRTIVRNRLGFHYKKSRHNRGTFLLIENDNIKAQRICYLKRIRLNDALGDYKKPVVYLDESWIFAHFMEHKKWQLLIENDPKFIESPGLKWLLIHAGGEYGRLSGGGHLCKFREKKKTVVEEFGKPAFLKYMKENVFPNIPQNSLVILGNAPYHSMQVNKVPTVTSSKEYIFKWLDEKSIPYDRNCTKAELLKIVSMYRPPRNYVVDNLLTTLGHEVLRLPPVSFDLNPAEYIWNSIKQKVYDSNTPENTKTIEELLRQAIESITDDDWKSQVHLVKTLEQQYWVRDVELEKYNDDFVAGFGVNPDTDYESEDDDEDFGEIDSGVEDEDMVDPGEGSSKCNTSIEQNNSYNC